MSNGVELLLVKFSATKEIGVEQPDQSRRLLKTR